MTTRDRTRRIDMLAAQPVVHFAERAVSEPDDVWGPRINPDCQLLYVLSGQIQLELGAESYTLTRGTCAFYGSGSPHRIATLPGGPAVLYSVHFEWEAASPVPVHPSPGILPCRPGEQRLPPREYQIAWGPSHASRMSHVLHAPELEVLFRPIVEEYMEQGEGYETALRGHMTTLLIGYLRSQRQERPDPALKRIAPALDAIALEPGRVWSSRELAGLCGYHPVYFADLFKTATGLSPKAYTVQKRIARAKRLLLTGESITDIAKALGYDSVHYFSRNFREVTGLTPSEFRLRPEE
ncbi:helix-turn-helix domain-containing protein [Paenibacillus sp. 1P07SE]|uniref:helix-turn-helix transcriptional regulator n=1 Tax=Paenibacillus sp. 1P07SE TaxID=3132209 RepID=UPI0039A476DC